MNSINADLHCHSLISDGTLSPEEVAHRAHANGVQIWSLTDHDILEGQARAQRAAIDLGMTYIPGVEISVSWCDQTIHIVGLNIDYRNQALVDGLYRTRHGRANRAIAIGAELEKVGIAGAYQGALKFVGNMELISRTHFARFLVESGVCKNNNEVFSRYLIAGKPGYVPHVWATLSDAVHWILGAGGVAVIAHPGRYSRLSDLQREALYREFKGLGGQGIEVVTGSHTADEYQIFAKVALQYGFLVSRGSDFHDPHESNVDLGMLPPLPSQLRPVWSVFQ